MTFQQMMMMHPPFFSFDLASLQMFQAMMLRFSFSRHMSWASCHPSSLYQDTSSLSALLKTTPVTLGTSEKAYLLQTAKSFISYISKRKYLSLDLQWSNFSAVYVFYRRLNELYTLYRSKFHAAFTLCTGSVFTDCTATQCACSNSASCPPGTKRKGGVPALDPAQSVKRTWNLLQENGLFWQKSPVLWKNETIYKLLVTRSFRFNGVPSPKMLKKLIFNIFVYNGIPHWHHFTPCFAQISA